MIIEKFSPLLYITYPQRLFYTPNDISELSYTPLAYLKR